MLRVIQQQQAQAMGSIRRAAGLDSTPASSSGASSQGSGNSYDITREAWEISSVMSPTPIQFNINPSSADFNFTGRGSTSSTSVGRVFDRYRANNNLGMMDLDLTFTMQTGSLLGEGATPGHEVLFKLLELLNEDLYVGGGEPNLQTLKINTVTFGYMELTGLLAIETGLTISESADDPFKSQYPLTFHAIASSPSITSSSALLQSL